MKLCNMKRIIILVLICLTAIIGCEKQDSKSISSKNIELISPEGVDFFESESKMTDEVKAVVGNDLGMLKSFGIKKIQYYEDKTKSLALVNYEANGIEHANVAFLIASGLKSSFKCTATSCLCRIDIYPDGNGQYIYECGGCNTNCHFEVTQN